MTRAARGRVRRASSLASLRAERQEEIAKLPEVVAYAEFGEAISSGSCELPSQLSLTDAGLGHEEINRLVDAGIATFALHTEARIASLLGHGFYTIGPCGEELMAAVALSLRSTDASALHYRHVATQVMRQLGSGKSMEEVLLDRARGYVVSAEDPVCGGAHCAIGGGPHDFVVTSTLASQAPPAVGRALGSQLMNALGLPCLMPKDSVSLVSVGDGSVNNAHFLAATNLAAYAKHRNFKCPTVFMITDNQVCISLKGYGWIEAFQEKLGMPVYRASGADAADLHTQTQQAFEFARKKKRPCALLVSGVPRRFGHAATDRQGAYLSSAEISLHRDSNPLLGLCAQAVASGATDWPQLLSRHAQIRDLTQAAFEQASLEPKISERSSMLDLSSAPLKPVQSEGPSTVRGGPQGSPTSEKPVVMRKNMTRCLEEEMTSRPELVYIGEDVRHGGYYVVTEGLAAKFPERVMDFPPDETTLIGAGMGYAQVGMLPIVEIPYAKYLDCGADMFFEACIMNWLTKGNQPNGMVIRLQGFDRGVFGGNFHTHNMLHLPPGLDTVCYSNGADWVRGMRYSLEQAKAGRVVMMVDCTNALNLKHVQARDQQWLRSYPSNRKDVLPWDSVTTYSGKPRDGAPRLAVVSYGNGVPLAIQAAEQISTQREFQVDVCDSPYLSAPTSALQQNLEQYDAVLFADICKQGNAPLGSMASVMHSEKQLPGSWGVVAAPAAYNPLGNLVNFLSVDDIVEGANKLV